MGFKIIKIFRRSGHAGTGARNDHMAFSFYGGVVLV